MDFPLRCRCGQVEGRVAAAERARRAVCYCRDCQSFARFLGEPGRVLNEHGGTDIVATTPRFVSLTRGQHHLRCMSLSPKGLLRWYTACCRTPIGNTPRDPRISYVGLVHSFLAGSSAERDAAFGPARAAINTESARGHVKPTRWATLAATLGIIRNVATSRLTGRYRANPFFRPGTSEPIVTPEVVTETARRELRGDA